MIIIEGREPKEKELVIPPLKTTFLIFIKVIGSNIKDLHISTLECQDKGQIEESLICELSKKKGS
jgi:hypothetical protein